MIWRLTYCNKEGVQARLDIIKGSSTPVEVIEGTATPFVLNYKMDKPDKSGFFMTSSADISIFETASFNIDSLKTSSETEIKVEHYINNILDWAGFVIPDFFSKTIGSPATVEMVASDRLATLKGVTLTDLNQYVSMRDLAVACLAHTGLSLPLYTMADFGNDGQTNAFFKALGLSSRLSDTKGRNISCYDILKSILVASNSKLVQQDGAWHIVNKWQHEQGEGNLFSNLTSSTPYSEQTINFSDVHVGGRRSIVPVAAITGVYHEFGGGRSYPDNFDFRDFGLIPEFNFPGWTKAGTFNVARGDKEIIGYSFDGQMQFGTNTVDSYFFNSNVFNTSNYLQMDGVPVPYTTGQIEVVLDLNATAQTVSQFLTNVTAVKIALGAVKDGSPTIWLNNNGIFAEDNAVIHNLNFDRGATYEAQTKGFNLKGVINNPEGYSIIMRIYGSRDEGEDNRRQIAIHFARIEFKNTQDAPKGIIYKRRQGTDFTKEHDIDTTIFGDYMRKGLDGYFYEYPFDDTSSLYSIAGTLTQPLWTAPNDAEQLPLLHHITRQKSRMFSLAHNMISARINVSSFKPLNIFIDCNQERYVVVSSTYDFLRSEVEVELEQIDSTLLDVRDFIYSYFGDGESGISPVGGVSGGGGGSTGGGLTPEQLEVLSFWKKDPDNPNTIFTEMSAYSKLELSAYGVGDSGGGGGSDYERLDKWADYDSSKAGWVLSAFLGNDLNTRVTAIDGRVTDLENSAGSGSVTSVGISVPTGLSVSNSPITSSGVIEIGLQTGYSIPTTEKQGQWDAVVDKVNEIGVYNYTTSVSATVHTVLLMPNGSPVSLTSPSTQYVYDINLQTNGTSQVTGARQVVYYDGTWKVFDVGVVPKNLNHPYIEIIEGLPKVRTDHANNYTVALEIRRHFAPNSNINFMRYMGLDYVAEHTHTFASLTSKPTTLAGYGITDAYTKTEVNSALNLKLDKSVFDDLFEKVEVSTGVFAIKAKYNFYGVGEVSAYGAGTGGGGGGGIIETVYGYGNLGQTFNNANLTDTFNAYTINQINTRLVSVESGSALTVNTTGTGNAITSIAKAGSVITANKDLTFSLSGHTHTISSITNLENTLNSKLETSIFNTHNTDNIRHITGAERTKWDGVVTDFAELEIGSRNYLLDSNFNSGTRGGYNLVFGSSLTVNNGILKATVTEGGREAMRVERGVYLHDVGTFTYSIKIKGTTSASIFRFQNLEGIISGGKEYDITGEWQILHITFTNEVVGDKIIRVYFPYADVDDFVEVDWDMLVKGNKLALDWSPAPEDQVSDWLTTDANSFSFIKNKPTTLSGYGITDAYTKAQVDTSLNTKVSKSGDTISGNLIINGGATSLTLERTGSYNSNMLFKGSVGEVYVGKGDGNNFAVGNDPNLGATASQWLYVDANGVKATTFAASISVATPKVIFNAAGWSMEQVGSELQMKHNNVLKMRFTSTGSIVATEEITAFG